MIITGKTCIVSSQDDLQQNYIKQLWILHFVHCQVILIQEDNLTVFACYGLKCFKYQKKQKVNVCKTG